MKKALRANAKHFLSRVLPNSSRLRYLGHLPLIETWKRAHVEAYPIFPDRYALYDYLNKELLGAGAMDYLEFGVFEGDSIRYWSKIHTHAASRFVGFDTFTGLPEDWDVFTHTMAKSTFNVDGKTPEVDDNRVSFVKGLFQETLDPFLRTFTPRRQLVIHNDSDLYSATMYMLTRCHDIIVPGTIIIFDEFSSVLDEFRALQDYCSSYNREYEVVGATKPNYARVAIRMQ